MPRNVSLDGNGRRPTRAPTHSHDGAAISVRDADLEHAAWSAPLAIPAARGDDGLLDTAHRVARAALRKPEIPSPYARVMMATRQLEIANRAARVFVPDVEGRLASAAVRRWLPREPRAVVDLQALRLLGGADEVAEAESEIELGLGVHSSGGSAPRADAERSYCAILRTSPTVGAVLKFAT